MVVADATLVPVAPWVLALACPGVVVDEEAVPRDAAESFGGDGGVCGLSAEAAWSLVPQSFARCCFRQSHPELEIGVAAARPAGQCPGRPHAEEDGATSDSYHRFCRARAGLVLAGKTTISLNKI